jgi:hypothetical protein
MKATTTLYFARYGPAAWEVYSYTDTVRVRHGLTERLAVVKRYARMRRAPLVRMHQVSTEGGAGVTTRRPAGFSSACESWRRPYSRRALSRAQREHQLAVSRRAARPAPAIREKRLNEATGKWERVT